MKKSTNGDQDYLHNGYKAFKLLPNVRKFKIEISDYDMLFAAFGIDKRQKPKMKFEFHTNGSLNRYVLKQFDRMSACAISDPVKC
jgi:hypothetical protein